MPFEVTHPVDGVALLRMDDGKVNAMGPAFLDAFDAAWADATREGRVVVVAGNAKAFCAGLDLKTLPALDPEALRSFIRGFNALFHKAWTHPRPVVAAVDGPALAGGAILALCADFRLVTPGARLGLTEVQVGVPFPAPVAEVARATLPPQEHAPALLRAVIRQGRECVERGWAHGLAENPEKLVAEAVALAAELAALDEVAMTLAKGSLRAPVAASFERFMKDGLDGYAEMLASRERMDAISRNFQRIAGRK